MPDLGTRRWWALGGVSLAVLCVGLDGTVVSVALPTVFGGVAVARQIHSAPLFASVQAAFVHGMDLALLGSAGIALAGDVLTLIRLPRASAPQAATQARTDRERDVVAAA